MNEKNANKKEIVKRLLKQEIDAEKLLVHGLLLFVFPYFY